MLIVRWKSIQFPAWHFIFELKLASMKSEIWYLENFDFYNILCPYKLEDHIQKKPNTIFRKNEFLFLENDPCKDIILIDNGKVKVGQYDDTGNEKVINFLGRGEILGHMALMGESKHRGFAEVMENGTQVCKMSVDKARKLTRDYVPFALEMNRRIGNHIRKLERRIELLLFKDAKTRLVEFLRDLAEDFGQAQNGGIHILHNLTQSDIAALLGISRKSTSLLLNELEKAGIIEFDRKNIFIPDENTLVTLIPDQRLSA